MQTFIQTPTNNLDDSLDFYKKLKFKVISNENPTIVTDGKAVIEINPDRFARAGLKIFKSTWESEIRNIEKQTALIKKENEFLLSDPNGVRISLIEGKSPISIQREETSFGATGNFHGVNIETTDIAKTARFWKDLGFAAQMGSEEDGFISTISEDGLGVALMAARNCPHLFFNPSMTYFNGKQNLDVIQSIRDAGIPITEEITYFNKEGLVDNIIIRDPGGYGFFLFND